MLESSVDRLGRPVGRAGSIKVGQHVICTLPQRPPSATTSVSTAGTAELTDSINGGRRRMAAISLAVVAVLGFGGIAVYTVQIQQQHDSQVAQTQALADLLIQWGQPGTVHATLQTGAGQPVAAVLAGPTGPTVVTAVLPASPRDTSTYVLWGINSNGAHPLGTFDVAPDTAAHSLTGSTEYSAYAISLEPGRIMPASPTTVVASGPVQV